MDELLLTDKSNEKIIMSHLSARYINFNKEHLTTNWKLINVKHNSKSV